MPASGVPSSHRAHRWQPSLGRIDLPCEKVRSSSRGSRRRCARADRCARDARPSVGVSGSSSPCSRTSRGSRASPPACGCRSPARRPTGASGCPSVVDDTSAESKQQRRARRAQRVRRPAERIRGRRAARSARGACAPCRSCPCSAARSSADSRSRRAEAVQHAMIRSRPRFAAYVIGGPQLPASATERPRRERAADAASRSARTASTSSRQIASASWHAEYEPRPARRLVASREHELRVGELCGRVRPARGDASRAPRWQPGRRGGSARSRSFAWCRSWSRSGRTGRRRAGHDEPPWDARGPLASGEGGSVKPNAVLRCTQVDSVLSADGRRPARPIQGTGDAHWVQLLEGRTWYTVPGTGMCITATGNSGRHICRARR